MHASRIVGAACPRPSCPSGIAKEISDCELECTACGARFGVKPGTTTEYRNRYAGLGHMRPHVGIANMQDLREVAQHSPLVAMHLRIWEQGGFPSLEAALVSLAVHQGRAALAMRDKVGEFITANPAVKLSAAEFADVERILKRRWPNARNHLRTRTSGAKLCIADRAVLNLVLLEPESARQPFNVFANMCQHEDCRRVYFAVCEKPPSPGGEAGVGWSSNQDLARDVVEKFDRGQVISIKDPYGDAYGAHPEAVVPPAGVPVIMPEL